MKVASNSDLFSGQKARGFTPVMLGISWAAGGDTSHLAPGFLQPANRSEKRVFAYLNG